ncbi:vWA domain-containing protein [Saccharopolyspora shandongensis]|uniref:vWA domain-containing protein n=1 Tax=Saccharopolyspora shandongensis TaxID=418495 RepID=UPI00342A48F9
MIGQLPRREGNVYSAEINRNRRACLLLLIDQSYSMSNKWAGADSSIAEELARAVNRLLGNAVMMCTKGGSKVHDYFEVGVIGYGLEVRPVLHGAGADRPLLPISELAENPRRLDTTLRKMPDGAGGIVEVPIKRPVWIDPQYNGKTPMVQAFEAADQVISKWCAEHRSSFPPIVINLTDGESTDGDPSSAADALRQNSTDDGATLVFNLHLSSNQWQQVVLPDTDAGLPDQFATRLFGMSSELPSAMLEGASAYGLPVSPGARGFMYNAEATRVIEFLDIGTRAVTPTGLKELTQGDSPN